MAHDASFLVGRTYRELFLDVNDRMIPDSENKKAAGLWAACGFLLIDMGWTSAHLRQTRRVKIIPKIIAVGLECHVFITNLRCLVVTLLGGSMFSV